MRYRKAEVKRLSTAQGTGNLPAVGSNMTARRQRLVGQAATARAIDSRTARASESSSNSLSSARRSEYHDPTNIIRITSWNTQGDALSKVSEHIGSILPRDRDNILLIQEAGSLNGYRLEMFHREKYQCYFAQQESAKNKRCTTGILVCDNCSRYNVDLYHINLRSVKRPLVFCHIYLKYFSLFIVTVHATACSYVSRNEIKAIVDHLQWLTQELGNSNDQWILMGDFNLPPQQLLTGVEISKACVLYPRCQTHQSGRQLDYAIVSEKLARNIKAQNAKTGIRRHNTLYESDHFSIYFDIDPTMPLN